MHRDCLNNFHVCLHGQLQSLTGTPIRYKPYVQACNGKASQRSLHNAPIFRLLLKVAVNGTHQCDFLNFCGAFGSQPRPRCRPASCSCLAPRVCRPPSWAPPRSGSALLFSGLRSVLVADRGASRPRTLVEHLRALHSVLGCSRWARSSLA